MAQDTEILSFCYNNEVDFLKEALLLGVDPNARDFRGRSGLHIAAMRGGEEAMWVLLEAGAEATAVDSQGNTPLHMCGHKETVQSLIEFGAQVLTRQVLCFFSRQPKKARSIIYGKYKTSTGIVLWVKLMMQERV